ncbi:MAG: bifunctional diguanylate cyclase/phosphodiesterase [Acidimicrobiia bacterium]|nr:bifunctional diguanylate cyclase/phosphodiesterase [Acidimicrobiia bacterium]
MADPNDRSGVLSRLLSRSTPADEGASPTVDHTTGLPGRSQLAAWTEEAVGRSAGQSARALVAFVDIASLRDVNDSFGQDAGDDLLVQAAGRLGKVDLPGTRLARYGGAEFALVFPGIQNFEQAEEVARFLIELMGEPFTVAGESITVSSVVGAALSADSNRSAADVVRDAHQALVRARDDGPGSYLVFDDSRRGRYETRIDEERLMDALENEEFLLQYQPIVRLDTRDMVGVEALLRWRAPGATNSGMIYPHDFMPLLEKSGLAVRVGKWVLQRACGQLAEWRALAPDRPAMFVTCNLGPRQLAQPTIADDIADAVRIGGIQPWQLCVDITEEAVRYNRSSSWTVLRQIKEAGVKLALDDFGTGEAGLLYLRELDLDVVRIDRVFVEGMRVAMKANLGIDQPDGMIVRHVAALAHDLGLVTIAEGVEAAEEADALQTHGVDMAQGFHFGRPKDAVGISASLVPEQPDDDTWAPSQVLEGGES